MNLVARQTIAISQPSEVGGGPALGSYEPLRSKSGRISNMT